MTLPTYRLLGPLEVLVDGRCLPLGGPRRRALLAMLIANYDRPVSLDRLVAAAWDRPPVNAGHQARSRISELRGVLRQAGMPHDTIRNAGTGYAIAVGQGRCDIAQFEAGVARARQHLAKEELEAAERELTGALSLWRGTPLEGLTTAPLAAIAAGLTEQHLLAHEELFDVLLKLGHHERVIASIQELAAAQPWRERPVRQLLTALYRAGRQREALEHFTEFSHRLRDNLGLDPSPELVALRDQILRQDGALIRHAGQGDMTGPKRTVAWHPPAPLADFVGRHGELDQVEAHLRGCLSSGYAAIVAISGLPGVGKTSVAISAAHRLRQEFPAGQLYVDLRGHDQPLDPVHVLRRLLRVMGIPSDNIPEDLDEAADLYRSRLSLSPRIVLLDNAASATQVMPVMPPAECPVVVTSRRMITDLDGACFLALDPLPDQDALELLAKAVGWSQVSRYREAATSIVTSCGRLPLAVRIASAHTLATAATLDEVAGRLRDETRLLDHLTSPERSIRASLRSAYQSLPGPEQRLLIDLAVVTSDDFPEWIAHVLDQGQPAVGQARIARLVEAGFVSAVGRDALGQLRFRLHDLVRQFAYEQAVTGLSTRERRHALSHVAEGWHTLADEADKALCHSGQHTAAIVTATSPAPTNVHLRDPGSWFGLECASILYVARKAAAFGLDRLCWTLIWHSETYLVREVRQDELVELGHLALDSARRIGDEQGIACSSLMLAHAHSLLAHVETAQKHAQEALDAAELVRNSWLLAEVLAVRGQLFSRIGDSLAQQEALTRAVALYVEAGEVVSGGERMVALGEAAVRNGDPNADRYLDEGLAMLRGSPALAPFARSLRQVALRRRDCGSFSAAADLLRESLLLLTKVDDPTGELCVHTDLAITLLLLDQVDEAKDHVAHALSLVERMAGPHYAAYATMGHGLLLAHQGDPAACDILRAAADGLKTLPSARCRALIGLGLAYHKQRDPRAGEVLREALQVARSTSDTHAAARATSALAAIEVKTASASQSGLPSA